MKWIKKAIDNTCEFLHILFEIVMAVVIFGSIIWVPFVCVFAAASYDKSTMPEVCSKMEYRSSNQNECIEIYERSLLNAMKNGEIQ